MTDDYDKGFFYPKRAPDTQVAPSPPPDRAFEYLLNAMEHAAQSDTPAEHGYAEKRKAVFAFVRRLQLAAKPSPPVAPDSLVARLDFMVEAEPKRWATEHWSAIPEARERIEQLQRERDAHENAGRAIYKALDIMREERDTAIRNEERISELHAESRHHIDQLESRLERVTQAADAMRDAYTRLWNNLGGIGAYPESAAAYDAIRAEKDS